MAVAQGDVFWADLPEPTGSGPGLRRPVLIVQGNAFNRSRIATVVAVPLTSNLRLANAPGNVSLRARATGLPKDSVANVSRIVTIDRGLLTERTGHVSRRSRGRQQIASPRKEVRERSGRPGFSRDSRRFSYSAISNSILRASVSSSTLIVSLPTWSLHIERVKYPGTTTRAPTLSV